MRVTDQNVWVPTPECKEIDQRFVTDIFQQFSILRCRAQLVIVKKENHTITKKTGTTSVPTKKNNYSEFQWRSRLHQCHYAELP